MKSDDLLLDPFTRKRGTKKQRQMNSVPLCALAETRRVQGRR